MGDFNQNQPQQFDKTWYSLTFEVRFELHPNDIFEAHLTAFAEASQTEKSCFFPGSL